MKMIAVLLSLVSVTAMAATPAEQVDGIDTKREGNLSALVLEHFKKNMKIACEEGQVAKFEITKVGTSSAHQTKTPGTPYDYAAAYLVVQKCLYGSTFAGAYSDAMKSSLLKGSFTSKYNRAGGPLKMESLKIEAVRDVDVSVQLN